MSDGVKGVRKKIRTFQRKYYLNMFIRGVILTLATLFGYFLLASLLEHNLWLGPTPRLLIFLTFFAIAGFCIFRFLNLPFRWWLARRGLSDEEAARIIGSAMPGIRDRLVNLIQLAGADKSALAYASVQQKTREFEPMSFESVVDLRENRKYLKYLAIPLVIAVVILLVNQNILFQSTNRIVHFNQEFTPAAPFSFHVQNESLLGFHNEDFTLRVQLTGGAVPANAYLISGSQRYKLVNTGPGSFEYTLEKLQRPFDFQIQAAGFYSDNYRIGLVNRPEVTGFNVDLEYPRYLQRTNDKIANAGNLEVPEGTVVRWKLRTAYADSASIRFLASGEENLFTKADDQIFAFQKAFREPDHYEINLQNAYSANRDKISYRIDVIKDQYPDITVTNFQDSILYKRVIVGGMIGDDHGVTQLALNFRVRDENAKEILSRSVPIPITRNQLQQSFFYNWSVDSLRLKPGQRLEYHLQVWDNDGVNGRKSTRSATYTFHIPTQDALVTEISKSTSETQQQIDRSAEKASTLQEQIEQAHQKLKGKQNLDWQDKKMLEDIIQQKEGLDQMINQLREQNNLLNQKKEAFTEQDERIREKAEQIQKLMDDLLDEETKRLFEELKKLLEEKADMSQIQKLLDKMNQNTNNLEKELERTLELFKQLKYDFKLDQTLDELKKQIEEQKELLSKTEVLKESSPQKEDGDDPTGREEERGKNEDQDKEDKSAKESDNKDKEADGEKDDAGTDKTDAAKDPGKEHDPQPGNKDQPSTESQKLAEEQEQLKEEFGKTTEKLKELQELGDELDKTDDLPGEEETQDVQEQQEQSQEMLEQEQPAQSTTPQQKAIQKMQQMQQQMESMQSSMQMEIDMENLESLRQILHGLVKLSFDQEHLIKEFSQLEQNDPRFNELAQSQLKLKDDSKVLEDSLLALGKRDPMMGSFITREISELNNHLDKAIEANRERRRPQAASEMQMSMTSINNLALMLDDHFDMMMQMMANAQPSMKKSKSKKPGPPNLSQMQQQLNQKIEQLKNSGKSGRELSEELARMAAEQERIRRALEEMQEKMENEGQMPGGDLPSRMEETEMDLVNKQLTEQLIRRQREILTRLLEAEKSMREQDMDDERKGETAKDYDKEIPKAFEEYLRLKEKEVELLKTIPPRLYPYYKKEVNEYFKRMGAND